MTVSLWKKPAKSPQYLFDKTGTLTHGKPEVAEVWEASGFREVRKLAVSLGRSSTHPISQALVGKEPIELVELRDWQEIRGAGVTAQARMNGVWQTARLGSLALAHGERR